MKVGDQSRAEVPVYPRRMYCTAVWGQGILRMMTSELYRRDIPLLQHSGAKKLVFEVDRSSAWHSWSPQGNGQTNAIALCSDHEPETSLFIHQTMEGSSMVECTWIRSIQCTPRTVKIVEGAGTDGFWESYAIMLDSSLAAASSVRRHTQDQGGHPRMRCLGALA